MSKLLKWKTQSNRKPLLLEGARQVGKTYLLQDFGKRHFKNVAYVNFQNPSADLIDLFNGSRLDDDLQNISLRNIFLFEHLLDNSCGKCVKS